MPANVIEDNLLNGIAEAFEAINVGPGFPYYYKPFHAWRVSEVTEKMLGEYPLAWFIYPGDGFFEPATSCVGYTNTVGVFALAALKWKNPTTFPWRRGLDSIEESTARLRLMSDARYAVKSVALPPLGVQQLWISDRDFQVYANEDSWLLARFSISAVWDEVME